MSRDISLEPASASSPAVTASATGAPVPSRTKLAEELGQRAGVSQAPPSGWFTKLIVYYLRRYKERDVARGRAHPKAGQSVSDAARSRIRRASVKSAISGSLAGALSTAATMLTAQTEGLAGLVAIPVAALGIGGEMMYRSLVHFELTVQLADLFGVDFDPTDPADIIRLYSLVFKTGADGDDEAKPDATPSVEKDLVHKVKHLESSEVGEQIGDKVLGESVVRNIVPFVGIVSSAVTNYVLTQRLGNTVRRYMRYQRALDDTFERAATECGAHLDLLVEGVWFIFTADGRLSPEEVVTLVKLLERLDPVTGHATLSRFVEDELDWADRLEQIPEEMRAAFFHALEVAACVDKEVTLPERKILRRAAHHLGLELDMARLTRMVRELEEEGVLAVEATAPRPS
jgi:uncharacterized tellurite resistance protein B-like protein